VQKVDWLPWKCVKASKSIFATFLGPQNSHKNDKNGQNYLQDTSAKEPVWIRVS
jgi:hypothetical protein